LGQDRDVPKQSLRVGLNVGGAVGDRMPAAPVLLEPVGMGELAIRFGFPVLRPFRTIFQC
jgi:hypothetical protein